MKKIFILLIIILLGFPIHKTNEPKNIYSKTPYYIKENLNRYKTYHNKHKISTIQVVKDVNMDLDREPYQHMHKAKNLNKVNILVNKHNYLEENYIPKDLEKLNTKYARENMYLVKVAKTAFEAMASKAEKQDLNIIAMSTYRSYKYQVNLYNSYVQKDGTKNADTYSGRPGNSEHQTGLALDVYNGEKDYTLFEYTNEYDWLQENAYKYGFILRFPKGKEKETGYEFESWHYRYVGKPIAKEIHKKNISLEEYIATNQTSS